MKNINVHHVMIQTVKSVTHIIHIVTNVKITLAGIMAFLKRKSVENLLTVSAIKNINVRDVMSSIVQIVIIHKIIVNNVVMVTDSIQKLNPSLNVSLQSVIFLIVLNALMITFVDHVNIVLV